MSKEKKPGWTYYKSELFNEEFAIHDETGWLYFENGARYSPEEIKIIVESGNLDLATHRVKTLIEGEIVTYGNGTETENKRKPVENGELDIF